ncbi:hypothetical protein ASE66_29060 [Bosea sp. Root483D1]|nr:hypothetical protein ASE66_29060 [Bosea sp. Root483D1]
MARFADNSSAESEVPRGRAPIQPYFCSHLTVSQCPLFCIWSECDARVLLGMGSMSRGHHMAEEAPEVVAWALRKFFAER